MKSYKDYLNEELDEVIRYATAAKDHSERANLYISQARKHLKKATQIEIMIKK